MLTHYGWWIAAALLALAEVMTGTFYVLMVAIGCAAGGALALLAFDATVQTIGAIVVGLVSLAAWHFYRKRSQPRRGDGHKNPDMHLDIGAFVDVSHWSEGHARVNYRGSQWDAEPEHPQSPETGKLMIKAVRGSTLVLGAK